MRKTFIIIFIYLGQFAYSQNSSELYYAGIKLSSEGNWEEAILKFDEAIYINNFSEDHSSLDYTYFKRGYCKKRQEKYMEALKDYTKAIDLCISRSEYCPSYFEERGHLRMILKDYNGAVLDYKKGNLFVNHYYIGKAYFMLENYNEARKWFKSVIGYERSDEKSYYYYYLGICELQLNILEDACVNLRRASDLGDQDALELIVKHCN